MNRGKWKESDDFLGLADLAPALTPEHILQMDTDFYMEKIQPKFFYLKPDELWKWKINALNFMRNHDQDE